MKFSAMLMLAVLQVPVAPQPATVQGTVLDALTSQPLARASVDLLGGPSAPRGTVYILSRETGSDGTFNFKNVPPGDYTIEVSHSGYLNQFIGGKREEINPVSQTLNPGQSLTGIQVRLVPAGVIYGRLVSDRNEPLVGATVQAWKTRFRDGRRTSSVVQSVVSNDLGEYRLFNLPAGEYRISVIEATESLRGGIPWHFPGTVESSDAQLINLKAGEILGGISFGSIPTRPRKVAGIVHGAAGDGAGVVLSSRGGDVEMQVSANVDTGAFSFAAVPPGAYTLVARSRELRASMPLDVRNADIQNARITLAPGHRIPVRIRIDGHGGGPDPALEELYLVARREAQISGLELDTYSPFADGRFAFDLLAGDYRIEISRGNGYLKSIKLGNIDVLNQGLQVNSSTEDIMEIVVGEDFGSVSGRAAGKDVTVVLVPDPSRRGQRVLYQATRPDTAGEFTFQKVPPGEYKLFAWQEEEGGPWRDPEYLARYEERGVAVRVGGNQKLVVDGVIPLN